MADHSSPSSNQTPVEPVELTGTLTEPWSAGKLLRMLTLFGPAAIVASVAIGAGETIVVVRAGSWCAYDLLWVVLLSAIVKGVFVTYLLGRYTAISGEPLSQRLCRLPGPRGWLLLALILLELAAAGPLWAAVARPCGDLLVYLVEANGIATPGPNTDKWVTTIFIGLALLVSLFLDYEKLEKQQVIICGVLILGTILGTLLVKPDLGSIITGSLGFGKIPEFPAWTPPQYRSDQALALATLFGYVGGSVLTYVVYADWISLHRWGMTGHPRIEEIRRRAAQGDPADYLPRDAQAVAKIRKSIAPLKWDVGLGAFVLWSVSGSFLVAGAVVLYPMLASGEMGAAFQNWSLLTDQAHVWRSVHESLIWVYYISVLIALWGTLQAYPEIYSRVVTDYCQAMFPGKAWTQRRVQLAISGYVLVTAMAVIWSDLPFDTATQIVAFLATNLGVALALCAALYLNFRLPSAYRTRWWMLAGGLISAALLLAVSVISGLGLWHKIQ